MGNFLKMINSCSEGEVEYRNQKIYKQFMFSEKMNEVGKVNLIPEKSITETMACEI